MPKDHFVPQQHLRRFGNGHGRLWELVKNPLRLGSKTRSPKWLCQRNDYYRDEHGRWFDDLVTSKFEDRFAKLYNLALADHDFDDTAFVTYCQWAFLSLVRGPWGDAMIQQRASDAPACKKRVASFNQERLMLANALIEMFEVEKWFFLIAQKEGPATFCTGDVPIVPYTTAPNTPALLVMPLSSDEILIIGHPKQKPFATGLSPADVNILVFAWANKAIYSGAREPLVELLRAFTNPAPGVNREWVEAAKAPLFDMQNRLADDRLPPLLPENT